MPKTFTAAPEKPHSPTPAPTRPLKTVILAGGLGARLAEETEIRPKPMVEIGGRPILWHILKHYAFYGHREFFIALGYKGDAIKRFFLDRANLAGDLTVRLAEGRLERHNPDVEDWTIHLIDTGRDSNTGGRLRRLRRHLPNQTFLLTYGDGVSNIDLEALVQFHKAYGLIATITAVRPPARFGGIVCDGNRVARFTEKSQIGEGWINGGFLVLEPGIFDYLSGDDASLEVQVLEQLAADGQLAAFKHHGFWQCMDTLRDKRLLEDLWLANRAPWKIWE